ncbi:MAG: calcium/sodium antiporter [Lachnospiraceae bacterium]|nr:calcium/sodium antiporter [Lachnospiraceae bacterium]
MITLLSFWESYITNPTLLRIVTNPYLLFAIGLVLLIKGGDWFVDGASGIAKRYHVPELLIGATVVSIGTTLPEVMVSSGAAFKGVGDIAYGNAIGSVICNTALIAAITVAVKPSKTERKTLILPVVSFFLAAAVYCVAAYGIGTFSRPIGIVLLSMFVLYMVITIRQAVVGMKSAQGGVVAQSSGTAAGTTVNADDAKSTETAGNASGDAKEAAEEKQEKERSLALLLVMIVVGAALIAVGADLLVDNATIIAKNFGVSDAMIALTVIALGTSLPELVTAITSLIKGHGSLSLGNVIGANLFNLVLVSGMAVTICPFGLPSGKTIAGINSSLVVDLPVMLFVMALLTIPALVREKLSRLQGILLLVTYAAFTAFQIVFSLFF